MRRYYQSSVFLDFDNTGAEPQTTFYFPPGITATSTVFRESSYLRAFFSIGAGPG
jgi:hypothetical protein